MEKLEPKYIAPYLPYRLIMQSPYGFRPNAKESVGISRLVYLTGDLYADIENDVYQGAVFKPVLRPLSNLWKEDLEYLINSHSTDYFSDHKGLEELINGSLEKGNLHHYIEFLPFGLVQWLIENHYDIYNLIEQGLAIDINTIKE